MAGLKKFDQEAIAGATAKGGSIAEDIRATATRIRSLLTNPATLGATGEVAKASHNVGEQLHQALTGVANALDEKLGTVRQSGQSATEVSQDGGKALSGIEIPTITF